MVFLIAFGVQAPLCAALVHLTGRPGAVLAVAGAITFGFIVSLFGGRSSMGEPGRLRLYLVLWPFFVWWTLGLLFAALAPLAFLVAAVLHAPPNAGLDRRPGRRADRHLDGVRRPPPPARARD